MELILTNTDLKALIDDEDYEKIKNFKWYLHTSGHIRSYVGNNRWEYLYRFILDIKGTKIQVDHQFHNKLDNRKENLRICTNAQNCRNQHKRRIGKFTSKYKGVCWCPKINKWRVTLTYNYKQIYGGTFENEKDAAIAYNKKAIEVFGEFSCLNEVE